MTYSPPRSLSALVGAGTAIAPLEPDYIKRLCDSASDMGVMPSWLLLACIDAAMAIEDDHVLVFAVENVMDRVKEKEDQIPSAEAANRSELERWKQLALYLAECHVATALHSGSLASSRSSIARLRSICGNVIDGMDGKALTARPLNLHAVRDSLAKAITSLDQTIHARTKKT